tara:strand:- start:3721 stop:5373 length:1653 start_codon:yes stop_codon:yes gene_type:complete
MASQGFFDYGDNFGEQIASNFGDYTIEDKKNVINFQKKLRDDPTYTPKPYESESLRRQLKAENETFSPRGNEVAKFASVGSPRVQLASVKSYIDSDTKPYAPDDVGDYIRDSETKSYTKEDSHVTADSYRPDVKTFDQMYGKEYKTHEEKREQFYSSLNKDLNVDSLGNANLPAGVEAKFIGNKFKYVKDGQELTRKEIKELDKDLALRTKLGKFIRGRKFDEMSALNAAERASYERNMPDPDDRKIDFYTAPFPGETVKPFEERKFDYQRENIRYGTAEDGTPTAKISGMVNYGEDAAKVYGTELLKKFIAADAKEDFENKKEGLGRLSTSQLVQRDKENYGETFPKGSFNIEKTRLEKAKEEQENRNILERVGDFLGGAFNTLTGTQAARGDVLDGRINFNDSLPNISTFSETGDPSFRSYRLGEDFSNLIRGVGDLPAQDTSFSSYVRGAQLGQERGNTRLQEARNIARRNPNVSINEKTGRAEATNNSGRARAQAMAVNRKLSGKSMSQVKSENRQAMRDRARARHSAFKQKQAKKRKKMKNKKKK